MISKLTPAKLNALKDDLKLEQQRRAALRAKREKEEKEEAMYDEVLKEQIPSYLKLSKVAKGALVHLMKDGMIPPGLVSLIHFSLAYGTARLT